MSLGPCAGLVCKAASQASLLTQVRAYPAHAVNRHVPVAPVQYDAPSVGKGAFVAPSGLVLGKVNAWAASMHDAVCGEVQFNTRHASCNSAQVALGEGSSVWYNAVVRGQMQQQHRQQCRGFCWVVNSM